MCITWTRKYTLCGCIWVEEDILCAVDQICLGRRMVILYSHLQTCKECWKSGDKRVNEAIAKMVRDQLERKEDTTQGRVTLGETPSGKNEPPKLVPSVVRELSETGGKGCRETPELALPQPDKCTCKDTPRRLSRADGMGDEVVQGSDEAACIGDNDITQTNPSRPQTPITDYDLDPDNLPWYLLHYEYYCDMSRSCEPVKLSSMWKDYRTTREKSHWVYLKGEQPAQVLQYPPNSVSCANWKFLDMLGEYREPEPQTYAYDESLSFEWDREGISHWWWWKRDCNY
ncbi:hypothetical protein N7486_002417 [Penicillium sp. IBT 16267x]|nr:hypothetical protein N7486_002417 [Penicillium sp. IBT 16267x]